MVDRVTDDGGRAPRIVLRGVAKRWGDAGDGPAAGLEAVDLTIRAGEFVCLCGPSGCGKTTGQLYEFLRAKRIDRDKKEK